MLSDSHPWLLRLFGRVGLRPTGLYSARRMPGLTEPLAGVNPQASVCRHTVTIPRAVPPSP